MALRLTEAQIELLKVDDINSRSGSDIVISSPNEQSIIMKMNTQEVARISQKGNFIIGAEDLTTTDYKLKVTGATGFAGTSTNPGHLYLTGADATSSISNTTQIVFGDLGNNHVAISSNSNAVTINPTSSTTDNQIVLDLDEHSLFPTGLRTVSTTDSTSTTTGSIITSGGIGVAKSIYSGQKIDAVQGLGVKQTSGTGVGISLYDGSAGTSAPTYGLMFAKTESFSTHGGVSGDWATYFTMSDSTTRGWIFRRGSTNVASVSGAGYLTLNAGMNLGGNITYNNGSYTDYEVIKFITGTNDGTGIVIGGGGLAVFGSGESASNLVSAASLSGATESTYITSDAAIHFITNCQTIADRVSVTLNGSREFYPSVTNTGKLGTASYNWSAVHARALTSAAALSITSTNAMTLTSGGNFSLTTTGTNTISSSSTLYLKTTGAASIIFQVNGTECGHWNPSGKLMIGSSGTQSDYELHVTGESYFTSYLRAAGAYYSDKQGKDHGFYIRTNGTWTSRWYQHTRGTVGDGTTAVNGLVYLMLGNAIASSTTTTAGAENAYGILRIYGTNTGYTQIRTGTQNTEGYTLYLPGATGQFIYHTNDTAEGSSALPVYITSGGKATAVSKITISSASGSAIAFTETRTGGSSVSFGVGEGNVNHGVYSNTLGKWMVYADASKVYLNGNATTATTLATSRSLKISSTPGTTGTSFNGSADATLIIPATVKTFTELGTNKISSTAALYITPASTLYLDSATSTSLIFRPQGAEKARFDTSGNFLIKTAMYPGTNNTYNLGTSSYRWKNIYGVAGSFSGNVTLTRSTTIADNTPAKLVFTVTQTDNSVSSSGYVACYDDLDANNYGVNMVINATSGLYLTAGEGAASYLGNNASTGEDVHICADAAIYFHTNCNTVANATTSCYITTAGYIYGARVYGAVWNDYAEYRTTIMDVESGRVVVENNDDTLSMSTERLMPGANIVSDTFGFAIGETEKSKTPIAVSGRVLAYPFEPREEYCAGDPVCSGPNGTVSKMTREEVMMYSDRMIGTVSSVPNYDTWGTGNVKVNGRIWIKVR